ncbi:MAG: diguanylate cyclase [Pseudomonadota bacterium]
MNKPANDIETDFYERMVARNSSDSMIVTCVDGLVEWVNEAFTLMSGFTVEDAMGRKPGEFLQGPDTDPATVEALSAALSDRRPIVVEILNYTKDGRPYWIEMNITPVFDPTGRHTHFMAIEREVSARKALEEERAELIQREKHSESERQLLSQVSEWLYSAKSLEELLLVARRALSTLFPEAEGSLYIYSESRETLEVASAWGDTRSIDPVNPDECWALRRGRAYSFGTRAIEFACQHVENEDHPYFCLPIVADGETIGMLHLRFTSLQLKSMDRKMIETFIDHRWKLALLCAEQMSLAIANVRLRQVLLDRSVRDPLTNLWNRRWLLDTTNKMIAQARTTDTELAIISLDIDHFKSFNDRFGHEAGDIVLREVAELLVDVARDRGAACRTGGEEFVLLCPGLEPKAAAILAEDIRSAVKLLNPTYNGKPLPPITVSGGISSYSKGDTVNALLRSADVALYAAKEGGRDQMIPATDVA